MTLLSALEFVVLAATIASAAAAAGVCSSEGCEVGRVGCDTCCGDVYTSDPGRKFVRPGRYPYEGLTCAQMIEFNACDDESVRDDGWEGAAPAPANESGLAAVFEPGLPDLVA